MNTFENFYNRIRDAKNAYNAVRTEDEKNTARAAYKAVWDELKELGNAAFSRSMRFPATAATSTSTSAKWYGTRTWQTLSPL